MTINHKYLPSPPSWPGTWHADTGPGNIRRDRIISPTLVQYYDLTQLVLTLSWSPVDRSYWGLRAKDKEGHSPPPFPGWMLTWKCKIVFVMLDLSTTENMSLFPFYKMNQPASQQQERTISWRGDEDIDCCLFYNQPQDFLNSVFSPSQGYARWDRYYLSGGEKYPGLTLVILAGDQ